MRSVGRSYRGEAGRCLAAEFSLIVAKWCGNGAYVPAEAEMKLQRGIDAC